MGLTQILWLVAFGLVVFGLVKQQYAVPAFGVALLLVVLSFLVR